ncbi:hypothetical protein ACFY7H_11270 [Streptomyces sp. NPDC012794]|uniref:hypothetical protein n=1 Tax=Streptomyces sp. NPDC012794 TaxID=3364850 RepID=UPI0036BC8DCF
MTVPVGGPPLSLTTTPARTRALAAERRLDVDESLVTVSLSERAGVPVAAALPRGEEFARPAPARAANRAVGPAVISGILSSEVAR